MKQGKVPETVLKRSVFKQISDTRYTQTFDIEGKVITTTVVVNYATCHKELFAVNKCVNNIYAAKGIPVGIVLCVILPVSCEEKTLKSLMSKYNEACLQYGIRILGGHTEVSDAVNKPIVTLTAIGETKEQNNSEKKDKNFDVVVTKAIGIEGTAIIAFEKEKELRKHFPEFFINKAQDFIKEISVKKDAIISKEFGADYMHDASTGGIFGGLWELSKIAGVGIEVNLKDIPVWQHTIELSEVYGVNPYSMMAGGSLIVFTKNGEGLVNKLLENNINAAVIGRTTDNNNRVLLMEDEKRYLEPVRGDEIYKIYE